MTTTKVDAQLEKEHQLNQFGNVDDWSLHSDLYICLEECYIYSLPGDDKGIPNDDAHILYDIVPDEIIQIDVERRNRKYVWCVLPMEGWIYLPDSSITYDTHSLDKIYRQKRGLIQDDKENDTKIDKNENNEDKLFESKYEDVEDVTNIMAGKQRDYSSQRIMQQTVIPTLHDNDDDNDRNKCMRMRCISWAIWYWKRHPILKQILSPTEGMILRAFTVSLSLFDIYSDIVLGLELLNSGNSMFFMFSMTFIITPYFVAWCVASKMITRQLTYHQDNLLWITGSTMYHYFLPFGVLCMILVDIYRWIEAVFLHPICLIFKGKEFREISANEEGYYKFREVAELFLEAIPQVTLQISLFSIGNACSSCTTNAVVTACCSSVFQLCKLSYSLNKAAKQNGLTFAEYITVVLQGSFGFVQKLPAIQRGWKVGEKVNWTSYKFAYDGVGQILGAVTNENCILNTIKIREYTIKDLHRIGCASFGVAISHRMDNMSIQLIITRSRKEITELFNRWDEDGSKSLDFEEFSHLYLTVNSKNDEPTLRSDLFLIYEELADSERHEVCLLDLQIKIENSLQYVAFLDYKDPLRIAYKSNDLKMLSVLIGNDYADYSHDNLNEFEYCLKDAILTGKIREALCLCERKGVPIIVRIENGCNLIPCDDDGTSDPYVRVSIFGQIQSTKIRKQTLNPKYDEDLLFILPFEVMDRLVFDHPIHADTYNFMDTSDNSKKEDSNDCMDQSNVIELLSMDVIPQYADPPKQNNNVIDNKLRIGFQVYDYDMDDEDELMGSYKAKIGLESVDIKYHQTLHTVKLQKKYGSEQQDYGSISYRIYLNVTAIYRDHDLHYIDSNVLDEPIDIFQT